MAVRGSAYGTPRLRRTNVGVPSDVGEVLAAMTHGSATVPDPLHPLHRDDVGAGELPLPRALEPVAFAMRHMRQRAVTCTECSLRVKARLCATSSAAM